MSENSDHWEAFEAQAEDVIEYAQAVLDDPEHPHRDDFGGYARETIGTLLKWTERLESRLSVSCQRNTTRVAVIKESLKAAEVARDEAVERAESMRKDRLNAEKHALSLVTAIREWWQAEQACRDPEHAFECGGAGPGECPECNAVRIANERLWAAEDTLRAIAEEKP